MCLARGGLPGRVLMAGRMVVGSERWIEPRSAKDGFKYDFSSTSSMSDVTDGWPVWIPLIVGLAPGLVYWLAITARRSK